jgi:hypothetical protein
VVFHRIPVDHAVELTTGMVGDVHTPVIRKPEDHSPPKAPDRYHSPTDPKHVGEHIPYYHPDPTKSPSIDGDIKITTKQLAEWAKLFDEAAMRVNLAGDSMVKIHVQPGYFQEANTIRDLITKFNGTFVPNTRLLSDAAMYVSLALRLVSREFEELENANLDLNTNLTDLISAMTKLAAGLKSIDPVRPNTPGA